MSEMFTEESWNEGWAVAAARGLTSPYGPMVRQVTRKDVEAIVSAVVNHGFEELYVDQLVADHVLDASRADALANLREHMRTAIAVEAIRQDCVMLTLPREVTSRADYGMTRYRLIVPVRRIGSPVAAEASA
jgi:hypothetical protein